MNRPVLAAERRLSCRCWEGPTRWAPSLRSRGAPPSTIDPEGDRVRHRHPHRGDGPSGRRAPPRAATGASRGRRRAMSSTCAGRLNFRDVTRVKARRQANARGIAGKRLGRRTRESGATGAGPGGHPEGPLPGVTRRPEWPARFPRPVINPSARIPGVKASGGRCCRPRRWHARGDGPLTFRVVARIRGPWLVGRSSVGGPEPGRVRGPWLVMAVLRSSAGRSEPGRSSVEGAGLEPGRVRGPAAVVSGRLAPAPGRQVPEVGLRPPQPPRAALIGQRTGVGVRPARSRCRWAPRTLATWVQA
jgi:hypothetical protein